MPATILAAEPVAKVNVLLVHGALSEGGAWREVIPSLQAAGHHVVAEQNPLIVDSRR